jgi:hypothetical protein
MARLQSHSRSCRSRNNAALTGFEMRRGRGIEMVDDSVFASRFQVLPLSTSIDAEHTWHVSVPTREAVEPQQRSLTGFEMRRWNGIEMVDDSVFARRSQVQEGVGETGHPGSRPSARIGE